MTDIINASIAWPECAARPQFLDWGFDYYARATRRLIVGVTGNINQCNSGGSSTDVTSPGNAWNVLTIGSVDPSWRAWQNPNNDSAHEKPELVVTTNGIQTIGIDGKLWEPTWADGAASWAAAKVSGSAAQFIETEPFLVEKAEAMRALLIASANSLEPPSGIVPGDDLKDGAGVFNPLLAQTIVQEHGQLYVGTHAHLYVSCYCRRPRPRRRGLVFSTGIRDRRSILPG
jgi:hypothetical protein